MDRQKGNSRWAVIWENRPNKVDPRLVHHDCSTAGCYTFLFCCFPPAAENNAESSIGPSRLSDSSNSSSSSDSGSGSSSSDSSDSESGQKASLRVCVGKTSAFLVSIYCSTHWPRILVTLVGLLHVEGSIPVLFNECLNTGSGGENRTQKNPIHLIYLGPKLARKRSVYLTWSHDY